MNRVKTVELQTNRSREGELLQIPMRVLVLRVVIALNFVLIILSFFPWFEGTEQKPGVADEIFGRYRLGGFRADFVWLTVSTVVIFFCLRSILRISKTNTRMKLDLCLHIAWIVAFMVFVARALLSGILYFG